VADKISDEALVVRGGQNRPEDIVRATGTHPSGITGVSVECATDVSIEKLATFIPHGHIGITTVRKVRELGGDVVRTSGRSPYHATLTGLTSNEISQLLTPTETNPAREKK
jgi:hypothetical protein